ncbi:MAG: formylglycine-generating enzyme family protein [Chitinophagales bacterium]
MLIIIIAGFLNSCTSRIKADNTANKKQNSSTDTLISENGPPAMVWIPGGEFIMGTDTDPQRRTDEMPAHSVKIDGFWMDITEVTNAQFAEFVKATGYITTAEKPIDWEEIKSQVAPGTPKPSDEMLMPASMVFTQTEMPVDLNNYMNWWTFTKGADWKHPQGPLTSIKDKDDHPVVQVSWDDAVAYCKWAGKRLPTEAEWEFASRGGLNNAIYPWGSDKDLPKYTNSWQGNFPNINTAEDGFAKTAPVKSYAANGYGLFDIAGNVWEWCSDWYDVNYYQACFAKGTIINPSGPDKCNDPNQPFNLVRVKRGGSFLCNDVYCSSYRITARMSTSYDTGQDHSGFRCVKSK